jgi:hypothetical protein
MKLLLTTLLLCILFNSQPAYSQKRAINKVDFFNDDAIINATVEAYWSKLMKQKNKMGQITPARFITKLPDSTSVNEPMQLEVRGHFRRDYCFVPPLKMIFKKTDTSRMHPLKSIKLVSTCRLSRGYEQYLLKEYLVYKMYNLLTDKSFKVRLLNIDYKDSSEKKDGFTGYAFLIEDLKDMGKRNNCIEWTNGKIFTESTDRKQMTLVALFEYMIGNTDWSVPAPHNIKLIQTKGESSSRPFAVPYDFDYSGIINTDYAVPDRMMNTETVTQRVYRGFSRTQEEIDETLELFRKQKENIYALVNNFELLTNGSRKNMINYLDGFFDMINRPKEVKSVFLDNSRSE